MGKIRTKATCGIVVLGAFLLLLPSVGLGQTIVNCPGGNLQAAIDGAADGTTISVNGTCNENIIINFEKDNLTVNGGGGATQQSMVLISTCLRYWCSQDTQS